MEGGGGPLLISRWQVQEARGLTYQACLKGGLCTHLLESSVCREALTGFSHVCWPEGLNNTVLSQGGLLENGSHCGTKLGLGMVVGGTESTSQRRSSQASWQSQTVHDLLPCRMVSSFPVFVLTGTLPF